MATLREIAKKVVQARATGIETGKVHDRLKGGRLWTEFREAAIAQGISEEHPERYLKPRQ